MPTRIAATAADTPPAYRRLNNYAQSGRERPAPQAICGLPTAGDLGPATHRVAELNRRDEPAAACGTQPVEGVVEILRRFDQIKNGLLDPRAGRRPDRMLGLR